MTTDPDPPPAPESVAGGILRAVRGAGADVVFGLPGVHNLAFWRAAPTADLARLVNVRHEQTCVYSADGWSRATGRLGVGLVTTGPGAANALGAFGEAAASGSPVLLVASEVPGRLTRAGVTRTLHQSADQAALFEPLAKAVFTPRDPEEVASALGRAIATALTSPRGPVYMDVPADVLGEPGRSPDVERAASPGLDEAALARAIEAVRAAASVVLWAGGGVVEGDAGRALAQAALALRAPVLTTFAGRGALPPGHPCAVGLPPHEPEVEDLLAAAQVLVGVGTRFDGMTTKNGALRFPPTVVHIDLAPTGANLGEAAVLPVVADAGSALGALAAAVGHRDHGLAEEIPSVREKVWSRLRADPRTAEAAAFVETVGAATGGEIPVLCDMAVGGYWLAGYHEPAGPRRLQYPMGWGTLGYALPASVGAALGADGPVLAVCGDGGLMFGLGELATLAQERLRVVVLVVSDGGYGMLRFDQDRAGDPHRGVDLFTPDLVALGRSFGIGSQRVGGPGDGLGPALRRALGSGEPRLLVWEARLYPPRTTSPRWHEAG